MNRDTTIVQIAVLMIAIAILGVAIYRQQTGDTAEQKEQERVQEQEADEEEEPVDEDALPVQDTGATGVVKQQTPTYIERDNSPLTNLVKQYFNHMEAKEFQQACELMSPGKCTASKPAAVESFSQESLKYTNGYEYIAVKDFGIQSPSGKDVVCVKYAYRYKGDTNPGLITEIMSYYIEEDVGKYLISDRVCEKKYKEGSGVRPCPIEARQNFCIGKIK